MNNESAQEQVGRLRQVWNLVYCYVDEIEYMFYNLIKENYHEKNYGGGDLLGRATCIASEGDR